MEKILIIIVVFFICNKLNAQDLDTIIEIPITMSKLIFNENDSSFTMANKYVLSRKQKNKLVELINYLSKSKDKKVEIIFSELVPDIYSNRYARSKLRTIKEYLFSKNINYINIVFKIKTNCVSYLEYDKIRSSEDHLDRILVLEQGVPPQKPTD